MKINTPPRLPLRFFRWFCHPKLRDHIEGDLRELYGERIEKLGKRNADLKFVADVLLLFRPGIIRPAEGYKNLNTYGMLKNYLKIGARNIVKYKGYSAINIIGLSLGMMVAILIGLWAHSELTFDADFQNHTQLAQVLLNQTNEGITYTTESMAPPVGDALHTKYDSDFKAITLVSNESDHIIGWADKNISANGIWVQEDFPEMFTLTMLCGSRKALNDPSSVLLSESLALSTFGHTDVVNKTMRIDDKMDVKVGGVFKDLPHNNTFSKVKVLLPWYNQESWLKDVKEWSNHCCRLFVHLADHAEVNQVSDKIKNLPTPYIKGWKEEILLQPIDRRHLYNEFKNGQAEGGRIQMVRLMVAIGVFVLLLACINFVNLSTARSERRAKEVGIRKTIGSHRIQLIGQFLTESLIIAMASLVLSLMLVQLTLPFFNTLSGKMMTLPFVNPLFWMLLIAFALLCGILSGSYPAFYLSSLTPVKVLKGTFKAGRLAALPRKALVVIQFTVSITLIIGTIIVFEQIQFAKSRPAGYDRSGLISVRISTPDLRNHLEAVRLDLLQTNMVEEVALTSQSPTSFNNNNSIDWPGKDPASVIFFRNVNVTPEFGKTIGWTIKEGRDFSRDIPSDSSAAILNEAGLKATGLLNPIGEKIKFDGKEYTLVGIVEDMMTQSPYEALQPAVFFSSGWVSLFTIRIKSTVNTQDALAQIETIFKRQNPSAPFEFSFVDEEFGRKFLNEQRIGNLAGVFAVLAIVISCLGIFGLASFMAEQRAKEIGVRKVLGASVYNLWKMLSTNFLILVFISILLAVPFAYLFMINWLQKYEYHTEITWWVFAAAGLGALLITLMTVSFQSIKAAVANPVNSLRSE